MGQIDFRFRRSFCTRGRLSAGLAALQIGAHTFSLVFFQ